MTLTTVSAPTVPVSPASAPPRLSAGRGDPASCRVLERIEACSRVLDDARRVALTVGLVPTMGALHTGHRSLIERAADECDVVAVSVFVNPLQFGEPDDIDRYPRSLEADVAMAAGAGASFVFAPSVQEMYPRFPETVATSVSVAGVTERWEGAARPGHFDGVTTVVAKLFSMAGRCRAYFGEKDFQQLAVVRRMVADLSFPVEVVGCPTVRDADGLALSSRNVRLSPEERRAALVLPRALRVGAEAMRDGQGLGPAVVEQCMRQVVAEESSVELDYAAVVHGGALAPVIAFPAAADVRLLIAARVGPVRLIDNIDPSCPGQGLPAFGPEWDR